MTAIVDTSIIIRYLTDDPKGSAEKAASVLDEEEDLVIPEVVVSESAYVLASRYGVRRPEIIDLLMDLIKKENVRLATIEKGLALQALLMCRPSGRVSYTDALTWAAAHHFGVQLVYTLDQGFPATGLQLQGYR